MAWGFKPSKPISNVILPPIRPYLFNLPTQTPPNGGSNIQTHEPMGDILMQTLIWSKMIIVTITAVTFYRISYYI